jgi:hypothetical protein
MHNSIPKYVFTVSISTVMTMSFHVKTFEKKVFQEVIFLLKYHQNPQVLKRRSIEKREKKVLKKKEQRKGKRKLQESLQIKGKSIFSEEKNTSTSKILSKIIEKVFLTLFCPSFCLEIYMT